MRLLGKTIFFDVDTQCDFVEPWGLLCVAGAAKLKPKWKALHELARKKGLQVFGDVDSHYGTTEYAQSEKELQVNAGPFPMHCAPGTRGWEHVEETRLSNPLFIPSCRLSEKDLEKSRRHRGEIIFEKQEYGLSSNKNFEDLMKGVGEAVVFGIATDYCVLYGVRALLSLGIRVTGVSDAIEAIDAEAGKKAVREMKEAGAKFASTKGILARFGQKRN
ncbi:Isochorismatase family protein [uncultured archaeon]|nr:Isochorismatase family protein [uncultured archaeon]